MKNNCLEVHIKFHKMIMLDIIKQFESYPKSRCYDCKKKCPLESMKQCCDVNNLFCQEKLIQAAEELDG
jgi:hypothetical protein